MSAATTTPTPVAVPRRLSPTALDRFRGCPKLFWFLHVAGQRPEQQTSPVLTQGNAVHHALENFYGLPEVDRSPDNLDRSLRSVWPSHRTSKTFASREEEAACGREALGLLADYANAFDLSRNPLAREQWLSYRLSNGIELYGKLDRIDDANGALDVIDYKTGRRMLDQDDLPRDIAAQVYALAARRAYERPVRAVRFIYLANAVEVPWYPEADDLRMIEERLVALTDEISATQTFDAQPANNAASAHSRCAALSDSKQRSTIYSQLRICRSDARTHKRTCAAALAW